VNQEAIDVGPVNRTMGFMPNDAFAAAIAGRSYAPRFGDLEVDHVVFGNRGDSDVSSVDEVAQ